MADDPLLSCRLKIDRAIEHFNHLHAHYEAFTARRPYRVVVEEDTEPAIKIHRVHIAESIPQEWSAVVGDVLHNLRSALDSLAASLIEQKATAPKSVVERTYFPIRGAKSGLYDNEATSFFGHIRSDAEKLIRRLEPYRGGKGNPLWQLSRLNIIDKHRRILLAGANLSKVQVSIVADDCIG